MFFRTNGYSFDKSNKPNKNKIVKTVAKTVLIKKIETALCKLLITLRPSLTTSGRAENDESSETRCDTFLAASDPEAIAIEQSATRSAKISLTPSPVIATVCPSSFKLAIITSFCSGVTRPKITYSLVMCLTSSKDIPSREMYLSAPSMPALRAISAADSGLSPVIIRIPTPFSLNHLMFDGASSRMWSCKTMNPITTDSSSFSSGEITCVYWAKTRTLIPSFSYSRHISSISLFLWGINSLAPITIDRPSSSITAENFLAELNGTAE